MRRSHWRAGLAAVTVLVLATGCARSVDLSGDSSAQVEHFGPDDTSSLWAALTWSINVDYPYYPTIAALTQEADLVVRGRVVDVSRHGTDPMSDSADVTLEVERVLSDPEGRRPTSIVVSIPVNGQNDLTRIDAEAPKPQDVLVAVTELEGEPGATVATTVATTRDASLPPLYGLISNDSVIDVRDGVSYTPFNDLGTPQPDDPYRGHPLAELEAAFLEAAGAPSS